MKLLSRMPASFFPFFPQKGINDCGNACLRMIATYYGIPYNPSVPEIRKFITPKGIHMLRLKEAITELGLKPLPMKGSFKDFLNDAILPCIAYWNQRHFVVVFDVNDRYIQVADPASGKKVMSHQEFIAGWETLGDNSKVGIIVAVDTVEE